MIRCNDFYSLFRPNHYDIQKKLEKHALGCTRSMHDALSMTDSVDTAFRGGNNIGRDGIWQEVKGRGNM